MFPVQPTSPKNQIQHWIYWRRMSEMQNTVKNIFFQKIYIEDCSYCKKTKKMSTCNHSPSCMHQRILNKKCYLGKWCCNITGNLDRYSNYCNKYKQIWQILHLNSGAGIFDLDNFLAFWATLVRTLFRISFISCHGNIFQKFRTEICSPFSLFEVDVTEVWMLFYGCKSILIIVSSL